jgi:hypothetical protein
MLHEAEVRRKQLIEADERVDALAERGQFLLGYQQWAGAERKFREYLAVREKDRPDAVSTFNAQSMLGGALLGQKKYAEAEPLLLKGYAGLKAREQAIPPLDRQYLAEALDRLVELYTATGKPDEVMKYRAELAKYPGVAPPPRRIR